jgi:hypothetical protein
VILLVVGLLHLVLVLTDQRLAEVGRTRNPEENS